ncbi:MAG: GNAT family N-acetyltransferase [Oscillospiraceae bacterium]|nr:GNAT family N-acetyltransferase [Oscillospiraceae bacterium]
MEQLRQAAYREAVRLIDPESCGAVYPLSVAQGYQSGGMVRVGRALLIRHYAGFAFLYGVCDPQALHEVYAEFLCRSDIDRRFILFAPDEETAAFFRRKPDCVSGRRLFFTYQGDCPAAPALPEPLQCRRIDSALLPQLHGHVTPRFSWEDDAAFLEKGIGYCLTCGEAPAAWSFSAALSDTEADIGIETAEPYRRRGYAEIAAQAAVRASMQRGRCPVWACNAENTASRRLAEKLGFVLAGECTTIKRR